VRILVTGGGTGGHLYPALAIARALVALDARLAPHFIGARRGIEREILPTTEFPHDLLELHPLYRSQPWRNWTTLRGLASAWRRIGAIARAEPPALVIGTGGYAAGATLGWGAANGVPIVLQEQNSFPGMTVRFFGRHAREVYLGFPEAAERFPPAVRGRCVDTGNPIAPPPVVRPPRAAARARWGFPDDGAPVLLIFGGSQGSAALNAAVDAWLASGTPAGLHVIWATGHSHHERHRALEGSDVRVVPYLSPIADAYAASDLALTRAGAMTTAELAAWGIPPILVPLPTAAADHQTANARALAAAGAARLLPQAELTPQRLGDEVRSLAGDRAALDALARGMRARARPRAAEDIAKRILRLLDLKQIRS
jgi:UDP-N-acetylglucosamine--N-acetylmuramyl-(pentapeptide) pyrophosphoryl-undecaprenol N-acetylglucosamine transferase